MLEGLEGDHFSLSPPCVMAKMRSQSLLSPPIKSLCQSLAMLALTPGTCRSHDDDVRTERSVGAQDGSVLAVFRQVSSIEATSVLCSDPYKQAQQWVSETPVLEGAWRQENPQSSLNNQSN